MRKKKGEKMRKNATTRTPLVLHFFDPKSPLHTVPRFSDGTDRHRHKLRLPFSYIEIIPVVYLAIFSIVFLLPYALFPICSICPPCLTDPLPAALLPDLAADAEPALAL